jgi:hypothetical protein
MKLSIIPTFLSICLTTCFISCTGGKDLKTVNGVLEGSIEVQTPEQVKQALEKTKKFHEYAIMEDTVNNVSVWGIGETDEGVSTEGYGIVVVKNATSTTFLDIRNSREPQAFYDTTESSLWFTSPVIEGTGTHVEQLYWMQFSNDDDTARIVTYIDPYQMQQELMKHLRYTIEGEQVTFYANGVTLATATNTITDMGGFDDEQPVWIGEQIRYNLNGGHPCVLFTPGLKFVTGLVLTYDNMPTLSAKVKLEKDGSFTLSDFKAE